MYTDQLEKYAKQYKIKDFMGVFPLDKLPKHLHEPPARFIINTDTHNLPGKHWIAVSYENKGIVYAFDPLGLMYPLKLVNYLTRYGSTTRFNRVMYQNPTKKTCGQHCLQWLKWRSTINDVD